MKHVPCVCGIYIYATNKRIQFERMECDVSHFILGPKSHGDLKS